jgi:hypothetical protein
LMLPEAWHDLPRGIQRNWKKHRRTQWRVLPPSPPKG